MKLYVAGPMSGLKQFNFPAFDAACVELREAGHEVTSPAELDCPEFRARVMKATGKEPDLLGDWGNALARDVKLIADNGIEGIVLLPGWEQSRGAMLEAFVGLLCTRTEIVFYYGPHMKPVRRMAVLNQIYKSMQDREFHR